MPALYPYSYGPTLLKLDNICLSYDGNPILRGINAEVKKIVRSGQVQGQVIGILGPSGMGKTQLFRIIAGLNPPTSGEVLINRSQNSQLSPIEKAGEVGVVAQSYPLFRHRTIIGNLLLSAKQSENNKAATEKVEAMLNGFELYDKRNLYPAQLSGGQRQRIAIIQQILCSEHFLLMDEPFSGLDIIMEEKTLQLVLKVANMNDLNTVIVVTHDVSAAASICDHIWMLGREKNPDDSPIPGARIMKNYDLIEAGLCWEQWQGTAVTRPAMSEFIRQVKTDFLQL
jgi:polar amino acid transport system ATP-binding protein/sulfate transport system ATP-binding protein